MKKSSRGSVSNSPAASGYVTVLSVAGLAGLLRFLKWAHVTGAGDCYLRITVDGGTPLYFLIPSANGSASYYLRAPPGAAATSEGAATNPSPATAEGYSNSTEAWEDILRFTSSLLVEVKGNSQDDITAVAVHE